MPVLREGHPVGEEVTGETWREGEEEVELWASFSKSGAGDYPVSCLVCGEELDRTSAEWVHPHLCAECLRLLGSAHPLAEVDLLEREGLTSFPPDQTDYFQDPASGFWFAVPDRRDEDSHPQLRY